MAIFKNIFAKGTKILRPNIIIMVCYIFCTRLDISFMGSVILYTLGSVTCEYTSIGFYNTVIIHFGDIISYASFVALLCNVYTTRYRWRSQFITFLITMLLNH